MVGLFVMAVLKWWYGNPTVSPQLAGDRLSSSGCPAIMQYTDIAWISMGTVQWFIHEPLHSPCGGAVRKLNTCYQGSPADSS